MSDSTLKLRTALMHDDKGLVQCIVPADSLLDLKRLHTESGRTLMPAKEALLLRNSQLGNLKPLPGEVDLFLLHTIIDSSLKNAADVPAGINGLTLGALRDTLHDQGLHIRHYDICVPAADLCSQLPAAELDSRQINDSIRHFTSLRIRQRLDETLEIPPLSATAHRILQLRANPNATVSELTRIVESDPSLAAQVVSWASSPYYAAPGKIRSVQDAIVRVLGFDLVSNLAVGLVLGNSVSVPQDSSDGFTPYWLQAVYCSTVVEGLARLMPASKRPRQGLIYLSGLLHNFGYLILAHTFPPHFTSICRYTEANPTLSHVAIEHHLIGISREQISAWLMQAWNMPEEVCMALRYQQDAGYDGPHASYANLIYVAMRLLRQHRIGDAPPEPVPAAVYDRLGLDAARCEELVARIVSSGDIALIADQLGH